MFGMRTNIMPIVERHGVDLVLSGHSHVYERSKLMNGFYDWSFLYAPIFEVDGGSGNETLGEEYHKSLSGTNAESKAPFMSLPAMGQVRMPGEL
jgi:3',5'-cyclic AMP phosphodiesterase CpdA